MNILCIGDVVGGNGCDFLRQHLPSFKKINNIDLVIANGENSSDGNGVTPVSAGHLFDSGVDVITLGNHSYRRKEIYDYLEENDNIIRPYNFPDSAPGHGICIYDMGRTQVAVINLMGQMFIDTGLDSPFAAFDKIIKEYDLPKVCIIDFHAEATGEKRAFAYYVDGKVSAVFGTHTHVPTADNCVLPLGTGYITDAGMTGTIESVLGVKPDIVIKKLTTKMPARFDYMPGKAKMDCIIFDIDEKSGLCRSAERYTIR